MAMTPQFPLTYKETEKAIEKYKEDLRTHKIDRADFWDFCGRIGVSDDEMIEVIEHPNAKNEHLSLLLKKYVTWQKGQYLAGPGWGGPNSSKAIFALKQKFGGYQFTDKQETETKQDTKITIEFKGAGSDPFA